MTENSPLGISIDKKQGSTSPLDCSTWEYEDYYKLISHAICIRSNERKISQKFKTLYAYYHTDKTLNDSVDLSIYKKNSDSVIFRQTPSRTISLQNGENSRFRRAGNSRLDRDFSYTLWASDKVVFRTRNPVEVLPFLEWLVIDALIPKLLHYTVFHAAALSMNGAGIIFPASTGFGKTTLSLALMMHGCKYFSDEAAIIDTDSLKILPLPRGLIIREKAFHVLQTLSKPSPPIDFYLHTSHMNYWYFNPSDYTPLLTDKEVSVKYIIFLEKPNLSQKTQLEKIPKARAVSQLLSCSLNNNPLAEENISAIMKTVSKVECYSLSGHSLQERASTALDLLHSN